MTKIEIICSGCGKEKLFIEEKIYNQKRAYGKKDWYSKKCAVSRNHIKLTNRPTKLWNKRSEY